MKTGVASLIVGIIGLVGSAFVNIGTPAQLYFSYYVANHFPQKDSSEVWDSDFTFLDAPGDEVKLSEFSFASTIDHSKPRSNTLRINFSGTNQKFSVFKGYVDITVHKNDGNSIDGNVAFISGAPTGWDTVSIQKLDSKTILLTANNVLTHSTDEIFIKDAGKRKQ